MNTTRRSAAQYVRMSTDRQDLSPVIQQQALAKFAAANGLDIVMKYEDEGRSGVRIANRPGLRQLLRDVTERPLFSEILVYDVSRWGRFQDADAAAYYEYHCRMHGVQVTYVCESFANDHAPASVLIKSMRRVMAAEYSRDIAAKSRAGQQRVVEMGFHMGALPPLGYRRCSVSCDGRTRALLEHGQRKASLTDRIEWVLAPDAEVALVRRIFSACAAGFALEEIAGLVRAEGWRTAKGRAVSTQSIRILLSHEACIGNFVWGAKSKGGKVMRSPPSRRDGSVPSIVDDRTWAQVQKRLHATNGTSRAVDRDAGTPACPRLRRARQLALAFDGDGRDPGYRRTLGSPQQLRNHTREFGRALQQALAAIGMAAAFDTRSNVLTFWNLRIRIRLMWPRDESSWSLERNRSVQPVQQLLVARMDALYRPHDFLLVPARIPIPGLLEERVVAQLRPYWCRSQEELVGRMARHLSAQPAACRAMPQKGSR